MQCPICGPNPAVIIADGVVVSFPSHRVESLEPPIISSKDKAWVQLKRMTMKLTSFPDLTNLRKSVYKALNQSVREESVKVGKLHLYRASRLGLYSSHFCISNLPFSTVFYPQQV